MRGYGVRALLRRPQRDPQELSVELQREMEGKGMMAREPDAAYIRQLREYAKRVEAVSEMVKGLEHTGIEIGYETGSADEVLRIIGIYAKTGGGFLKYDADTINSAADEMEKELIERKEAEKMSQLEVLTIIRHSKVPLTSAEISDIGWPDDNPYRVNATRDALYKLESWGLVRRAGTKTSEKGNKSILWEAVE